MNPLAHLEGASGKPHELGDHLRDVARMAESFAREVRTDRGPLVGLSAWAGLLHDLGKLRVEFQEYLLGRRESSRDTQHAIFGAAAALKLKLPGAIAFAIAGHHAGLHDFGNLKNNLKQADLDPIGQAERLLGLLEAALRGELPEKIAEFSSKQQQRGTSEDLLTRMLFSCLVDADFLDTERHYQGSERAPLTLDAAGLFSKVDRHVAGLEGQGSDPALIGMRRRIYEACVERADLAPGLFSLTTPTGGGKTLSSLAFALRHAERHGLRRVIVVIPFLSIIEQTARVYRDVLGDDVVVEHHSAVNRDRPPTDGSGPEVRRKSSAELAAENWDAPVIVTTSVQFLESLFARSPSRCRKLHNVARSVVILDEAHALPHHLLEPTLDVVRELAEHYETSFVFCSATQPGFGRSNGLPSGFRDGEVRELAPEPKQDFATLGRVRFELPAVTGSEWDWPTLVDHLLGHRQVLTIVNLRRHAVEVFRALEARLPKKGRKGLFHLSSAMCARHRSDKLGNRDDPAPGTIYHALKNDLPCRVVSTQVVEAGVDISFPAVYRALAPLDALIQSAGRCNREGEIPAIDGRPGGLVVIFKPADPNAGSRPYGAGPMVVTRNILAGISDDPSRLSTDPELYRRFFDERLRFNPSDPARIVEGQRETTIQEDRRALNFEKVAENTKVIEDSGQAVVVPYGRAGDLLAKLRGKPFLSRDDLRALQPYVVNLRDKDLKALGDLVRPLTAEEDGPRELHPSAYDDAIGVKVGERPPEDFASF